ncbi:MAG: hypothetical protein EOO38_08165 [Cytophagaceae bacterium]|jgi:hypothetical protein|nr:MAG: hypothetical protein EOO38_08165 [Cytophagaceae bacterium]
MSRYRKIDTRIWNDEKVRSLGDDGKLVLFMVLTHPSMTMLGAMRCTVAGMAAELGWTTERFQKAFQQIVSQGMAEFDPQAYLLALPNFLRYNKPESPNVVKAWASAADLLPECKLKSHVVARSRAYVEGLSEGFREAFQEAFAKTMLNQEQKQEQEQDQEHKEYPCTSLETKPIEKPSGPMSNVTSDVLFKMFWEAYPKKVGKDEARKAFEKRKPTRVLVDAMMMAVTTAKMTDQWKRNEGQFIPNPATWLNQGRWMDEGVQFAPTVAGTTDIDPALKKLYDDEKFAAKPTAETLAKLDALRRRKATA